MASATILFFSGDFLKLSLKFFWRVPAQKVKFSIKDFFSKLGQTWSFLWVWSHLLKKSLIENFIFCTVVPANDNPQQKFGKTGCFLFERHTLQDLNYIQ